MEGYSIIVIKGIRFVLKERNRATVYQNANFAETGKALAGRLKKGQSLEMWIAELEKSKEDIEFIYKKYHSKRNLDNQKLKL